MDDEKAAERAARVNQVLTWILEGASELMIREAVAETWPGAETEPLLLAAFEQVAASAEQLRGRIDDWCLESLRHLYHKQIEIGEFAGAMKAIAEMGKVAARRTPAPAAAPATESTGQDEPFPRIADSDDRRSSLSARIARIG